MYNYNMITHKHNFISALLGGLAIAMISVIGFAPLCM